MSRTPPTPGPCGSSVRPPPAPAGPALRPPPGPAQPDPRGTALPGPSRGAREARGPQLSRPQLSPQLPSAPPRSPRLPRAPLGSAAAAAPRRPPAPAAHARGGARGRDGGAARPRAVRASGGPGHTGRARAARGAMAAGPGPGPGPGAAAASWGGPGWRLPGRVLELVFSYLELRELRSCALVCKLWHRVLHGDENSEVWRSLAARCLAEEALRTDILCNVPTYKGKVRPGPPPRRDTPSPPPPALGDTPAALRPTRHWKPREREAGERGRVLSPRATMVWVGRDASH